jgi:hypothetical protein
MLIPLIVAPFHNLASMGFIFLLCCVSQQAYVVVNVKVEERSGLPSCFVDDKVIESVMLARRVNGINKRHSRGIEIIHEV